MSGPLREGPLDEFYRVTHPPDREFPEEAEQPVSCDTPTLENSRMAVKQLKSSKGPGGCGNLR